MHFGVYVFLTVQYPAFFPCVSSSSSSQGIFQSMIRFFQQDAFGFLRQCPMIVLHQDNEKHNTTFSTMNDMIDIYEISAAQQAALADMKSCFPSFIDFSPEEVDATLAILLSMSAPTIH